MEAFGGLQRRLTKLYSDTKHSCDLVTKEEKVANVPELLSLHLEFRIQRERLSAWGLEWKDDDSAVEASIDEEVARAGLTETVAEVLQNIQDVLEEAERIRISGSRAAADLLGSEKSRIRRTDVVLRWSIEDRARYEQLAKDLTDSIDLLYDLSRTRRELRQGTYPASKGKSELLSTPAPPPPAHNVFYSGAYSESSETLVNSTRVSTAKTLVSLELPSRLDPDLLDFPEEQPPPYDRIGATLSSRMIAYLKQPNFPSAATDEDNSLVKIPVLVEFAPFDPAYRVTGVPVPTQRLDALLSYYARTSGSVYEISAGNLPCLGFFEDPKNPRFGLVYELPKAVAGSSPAIRADKDVTPMSLQKVLQASSRTVNHHARQLPPGPPLEDRFRMAFNLVESFFRMHTEERFTHKSVNSANIIFFPKPSTIGTPNPVEYDVRTPFISSFDLFTEYNLERLPAIPAHNIYRNEDDPTISHGMCKTCSHLPCKCLASRFDVHGIALVLLEIGMWMPLADLYKSKYTLADFKHRIENIWLTRLRTKVGSVYTDVVQDMLLHASANITEESQTALYTKWLGKLRKCCLIDDKEDFRSSMLSYAPASARQSWSTGSRTITNTREPSRVREPSLRISQARALPHTIPEEDLLQLQHVEVEAAAITLQRAWRCKQLNSSAKHFRKFKNSVSFVQRLWRSRRANLDVSPQRNPHRNGRFESDGIVLESQMIEAQGIEHSLIHIRRNPVAVTRPKLRIQNVKLQADMLDQWHQELQPRLERIVERALRHSPESASIELHMVGETPQAARPTVFITCTSTSRVRGALAKKWHYDPTVIDIKVRRGKIRRSKATKTKQKTPPHRSMVNADTTEQMPLNPFHQQRPLCGASIGAFVSKHLPPVSFGGIVDVDGELFGMTVHHLLDDPSEDEADEADSAYEEMQNSALRSSGRHLDFDDMIGGMGGHPTLQNFPTDSMFPFEISDDDEDYISDEDLDNESDTGYSSDGDVSVADLSGTQGDISGVAAGAGRDILVTQPALDDVDDDFFPCPDDRDEDHLDSHTLGHVHASSGIKRWNRKGVLHEIDWALLKLQDDRLQPCNLIQGGRKYYRKQQPSSTSPTRPAASRLLEPVFRGAYGPDTDEFPTAIAPSDSLSNLRVHCLGRTSGLQGGVIGGAMSSVRIYKRRSFSRSWYVYGDFGVGGDSGAWVVDNDSGRVCGHVLAWCSRNSIAYICPAEVLLDDMQRTLGAGRICLPGGSPHGALEEKTAAGYVAQGGGQGNSPMGGGMPDISRLGLGEANPLFRSRLNGSAVSPRMEMQRLFGGQIVE